MEDEPDDLGDVPNAAASAMSTLVKALAEHREWYRRSDAVVRTVRLHCLDPRGHPSDSEVNEMLTL